MRFSQLIGPLAAFTSLATAVDLKGYEYVVVGSGAGGGYVKHQLNLYRNIYRSSTNIT
jgi:choline dehydrogenase